MTSWFATLAEAPTTCPECGCSGRDLQWDATMRNESLGAPNGRLALSDVKPLFVLGCTGCSETLGFMDLSAVLHVLNGAPEP